MPFPVRWRGWMSARAGRKTSNNRTKRPVTAEMLRRVDLMRRGGYSISSSGGTSISSETYFPFFFRWRTHSVSRYSICPLTDRKSSSAHAAIAAYSLGERRSGTCFFWLSFMADQYRLPELTTGWASWLPHSTTRRLLTIAALRSSSSSTMPLSERRSSAISTMPTAPSTIILRASMMAEAC